MLRMARLSQVFVLLVAILLPVAVANAQSTEPEHDSSDSCTSNVEDVYFLALQKTNGFEFEVAAGLLEELRTDSTYEALSNGCKVKILSLLMKCYEKLQYAERKEALVQQLVYEILRLDRNFDFSTIFDEEQYLAMAEQIRDSLPKATPRQQQIFSFQLKDAPDRIHEIEVGKTKEIDIRTLPKSVPVTFTLEVDNPAVLLTQQDSVTAVLRIAPDSSEISHVRKIKIVGETADTTRNIELSYLVKPAGKSNLWKYIATGAGAVGVVVGAVLLSGGDGDGNGADSTMLDAPPGVPNR